MKGISVSLLSFLIALSLILSCSAPSHQVQKEQAKGVYHRVKKGETFLKIARAYHVKLQDLAEANNIVEPGLIEVGSVIFVPDANQVVDDVEATVKAMDAEPKVTAKAGGTDNVKPAPSDDIAKKGKAAATVDLPKSPERKTEQAAAAVDKTKRAKSKPSENAIDTEATPARKQEIRPKSKSASEEKGEIQFEKKRFIWPVRGSVKTRFGIQPNKTYHNWIKIVSASGTQVKAAAAGIVIFSSQLKDFGETIIIRHEESFATVYTHLKKRYVKIDQNVKKGDAIALIGETDEPGDAYMNFEVRLRGKARNPLFFLP